MSALGAKKPGDVVSIRFLRRGDQVTSKLTLAEDPALEVVTLESTGARLTAEQQKFRAAWLSSRVK
jgi:predicted metalloprotease with PDZ domain